uniref:Secreted protein n=1 Tax=Heterorhabditis bacteriophora TaxID=37862 RepID=A0A1I7WXN5_HETBA
MRVFVFSIMRYPIILFLFHCFTCFFRTGSEVYLNSCIYINFFKVSLFSVNTYRTTSAGRSYQDSAGVVNSWDVQQCLLFYIIWKNICS